MVVRLLFHRSSIAKISNVLQWLCEKVKLSERLVTFEA